MILKVAIKYNEELKKGIDVHEMPKHHAAVQLGIEALKFKMAIRAHTVDDFDALLPGETILQE